MAAHRLPYPVPEAQLRPALATSHNPALAAHYGVSVATIARWRQQLHVPSPPRERAYPVPSPQLYQELARHYNNVLAQRYGVAISTVHAWRHQLHAPTFRRGTPGTPRQDAVRRLLARSPQGCSSPVLAHRLGISRSALSDVLRRLTATGEVQAVREPPAQGRWGGACAKWWTLVTPAERER